MKQVFFRKTTEYDLKYDDNNRFLYLISLGLQKVDPAPLHVFHNLQKVDLIFCSNLSRAKDSLPLCLKNIFLYKELKEVIFNIEDFCSEKEFYKLGSYIIRKKFKEYFIKDKLPISREKIFIEIEKVLQDLCNTSAKSILVISHSFRLKVFEAYIKTNGEIKKKPYLINKFITNKEKTYNFEEGFDHYF